MHFIKHHELVSFVIYVSKPNVFERSHICNRMKPVLRARVTFPGINVKNIYEAGVSKGSWDFFLSPDEEARHFHVK